MDRVAIYPATHHVLTPEARQAALTSIREELDERHSDLRNQNRLLEAQRLEQRTRFDLEMIEEMGYCTGIENYSRHLTGRPPGSPPPTLVDYFPPHFLVVIDESHQTVSQLGAMYRGDRSRKTTLVEHGFRLPSALDNRPLQFDEFRALTNRTLFVSATPGDFELEQCQGVIVEQIIRPTGLVDPTIEVRPADNQVDDLLEEIHQTTSAGFRTLVTTLTKRMSEDLTEFLTDAGVRVQYLHSDIDTLDRVQILRSLRLGEFDVLVGINLLREGLDLPEVALVAILDADKEGFLRSNRSLIQTIGRASRNSEGRVVMYANSTTRSMAQAIEETQRRREKQITYNSTHGITPRTVEKSIPNLQDSALHERDKDETSLPSPPQAFSSPTEVIKHIHSLQDKMKRAASELKFEEAATLRDEIKHLEELHLKIS